MTIRDAQARVLSEVRNRIRNGELTERRLARHLGISQPHVNNVLQGRRNVSTYFADEILKFLHCSVLDLFSEQELRKHMMERLPPPAPVAVPMLRIGIGESEVWSSVCENGLGYRAPCVVTRTDCVFLARVGQDSSLAGTLAGRDVALIDASLPARRKDDTSSLFVVRRNSGTALRWVRSGRATTYLADERTLDYPLNWEKVALYEFSRLDLILARVLWIGSEAALRRA